MTVFKCKMCGGNLNIADLSGVITCDYCGTIQTISKSRDDILSNLYNRANNLRLKNEFDRAAQIYEKILDQDNTESEAYWGIVLCKYGIEYVEDPATGNRIPTCHRTSYEAITSDADYIASIQNADIYQKALYEKEANAIDNIQKNILAIVKKEKPFDVFICYKETDENGDRTIDSSIANDIYYQLTQENLKTFYAPITLEDKLGHEYEPYIFAALNSAKVMLVVGTKLEYFESVWVRNEWSRFLKIIKNDRSKLLIPCYRDMDAYDLPSEFAHLQAQDMGKIGFMSDVVRGIKKIIRPNEVVEPKESTIPIEQSANIVPLLRRTFLFIEDEEWQRADEFCEQVLNQDPENGEAYIAKLLIEYRCTRKEDLEKINLPINTSKNFSKIIRFGNEEQKSYVRDANDTILLRAKEQALVREQEQARVKEQETQNNKTIFPSEIEISKYKGTICPHCCTIVSDDLFKNARYDEEGNAEIDCPNCNENLFFEKNYVQLVLAFISSNFKKIKKPESTYFDIDSAVKEIKSLSANELQSRVIDDYTWSEGYRYLCQAELEERKSRFYE